MNVINLISHDGVYYMQSWPEYLDIPENHAIVPDDLNKSIFYDYNGFVTLTTTTEDVVVGNHEELKEIVTVNGDGEEAIETVCEIVEDIATVTIVADWKPNIEAWESWKETLPEEKPRPIPVSVRISELEAQLAETDEVAIDLYEASLAQEAINAEQDEAIIEIYEMMEGLNNG